MLTLTEQMDKLTRTAWVKSNANLMRMHSQLARLLFMSASRDQQKGGSIEYGLRTKRPPYKWMAGAYDTYPKAQGPNSQKGVLPWAKIVATMQISGDELMAQHGMTIQELLKKPSLSSMSSDERFVLMSIINNQIEEAQETIAEAVGDSIYNDTGSGGVGLTGLQAIIDNSTSAYAGLNYNDSAFQTDGKAGSTTYWQPIVDTNSGTNRELTLTAIGPTLRKCRRGGDAPETVVAVCDEDLWYELDILLQGSKTYVDKDASRLAKIGFDAFEWGHVSFMSDERAPANKLYVVNLNNLWLEVRPKKDENNFEGWQKPHDQDAATGSINCQLQLCCNDRHRQGLVDDLAGISD
uniref:Putative structural protein n=1 Tax=viral metagenome TaxID=1070528 RepID=A0A6M3IYZ4_9ZZZZ